MTSLTAGQPAAERRIRAFRRRYERIEKPDGSFVLVDRETGNVVGAGFVRPGGREEMLL